MAWFGLVWLGMVRFSVGLFWLCMIRFDLRQHPSEASVNVSSRSDYFWMF